MLDHALDAASRGFRVFPLHPETKRPVWSKFYDHATTDPDRIREIWNGRDYNIGVSTDGLIVVDVDVKDGKQGLSSLAMLELDGLDTDTLTVRTPSGGLHLYYKGPSVANDAAGKLGEGLDIRSYHGYVIAPGSVFGGGDYTLERDTNIAEFPPALAARLPKPHERTTITDIDVLLDEPASVAYAREWLLNRDPAIEGQGGDAHTYKTFCWLRDVGLSEPCALDMAAEIWNPTCLPPWDFAELQAKAFNAFAYAVGTAGSLSPAAQFDGVQIPADAPRPARPWFWAGEDARGSVEWLYTDMLPTTGVAILSAPSGAGKTFVGLDLAASLASGRPWAGAAPVATGGTLILVGEAYGSMKLRMGSIPHGAPISATYVGGLAARGEWGKLCNDVLEQATYMQTLHGIEPRLVILDTLSSSGILEDEDNNALAATVVKLFADLSTTMKALVVVIHHPPKSGVGERGAGAIRNNADYVLTITRNGDEAMRELEITKSRDAECRAIGTFTLVPVETPAGQTMAVSWGSPRIKRETQVSHANKVIDALDLASQDFASGWTPVESVKAVFKQRNKFRNMDAVFKKSLQQCLDFGTLEARDIDGDVFLKEKDTET